MTKGLLVGEGSALELKVKSLIALAVAAQIPCQYCIWLGDQVRQAGRGDAGRDQRGDRAGGAVCGTGAR